MFLIYPKAFVNLFFIENIIFDADRNITQSVVYGRKWQWI